MTLVSFPTPFFFIALTTMYYGLHSSIMKVAHVSGSPLGTGSPLFFFHNSTAPFGFPDLIPVRVS